MTYICLKCKNSIFQNAKILNFDYQTIIFLTKRSLNLNKKCQRPTRRFGASGRERCRQSIKTWNGITTRKHGEKTDRK